MEGQLNELALFAGTGGGILGGILSGWRTVCAVEKEPYCREVLLRRQRDGMLPLFPIWDDIRTFDGKPWRGVVDVVSGGFPCQDISCAGKGAGIEGERSGLWGEFARIIREVQPRYAFVENSPMLTSRGLGRVLGDLAEMGYDAKWCVLGARHVGAPHKRDRIWILADTRRNGIWDKSRGSGRTNRKNKTISIHDGKEKYVADTDKQYDDNGGFRAGTICGKRSQSSEVSGSQSSWWNLEPAVGRVANGMANRVDRLRALGNGQVPAVAALAWEILTSDLKK